MQKSPHETAQRMIKRYGIQEAYRLAHGYATGEFYQTTEQGANYWFDVVGVLNEFQQEQKMQEKAKIDTQRKLKAKQRPE
jgi:hypothetical protein